jgi:hypothetical protein
MANLLYEHARKFASAGIQKLTKSDGQAVLGDVTVSGRREGRSLFQNWKRDARTA